MNFVSRIGRAWYTATCAVLVLCFVALASLWVQLVPVFQSPDEPAHFDYAFALASAGTLLRAADGPPGFDPHVATAMRDTNLNRIAFHVDERVDDSYETRTYRTTVLRENEAFRDYSPRNAHAVRPGLISVYPFAPYALYALAAYPFRGDVISALYACRFASVAFSAIGLFAWSRILRRLRIPKTHAVALVAIVAFFPLTSFVGSYVQPDGVAFAIASLLILVTLRIRDGRADAAHGIVYAVLLSALYGTKLQFAVAVGIATAVPVSIAYVRFKTSVRLRTLAASTSIVGLALVYATTQWVMQATKVENYFHGHRSLTSALAEHAGSGEMRYLVDEFGRAVFDLFGGGISSRSFWGYFGWLDAPIAIVDYRMVDTLIVAEAVGTMIVTTLLAISLAVGLRRLIRIARRRSRGTALRLATNDPAFNAYAIFAVLIVGLYIASANDFVAQGRNWYAFEVVAFATASWYGTRSYFRQWRRPFSAIVLVSLGLYACVGSVYAVTTIEDRYYRPLSYKPSSNLERFTHSADVGSITVDSIRRTGSRMTITGWAYDPVSAMPCGTMYALINDRFEHWILYGFNRDDVGRAFARFDLARTGFKDVIDLNKRHAGRYKVAIGCISKSELTRFDPKPVGDIVIDR